MQKITPYLWFDSHAEEAATFYTSLFDNSRITNIARFNEGGPGIPGSAMNVNFVLDGQEFIALNGGPQFQFTEAISMFVNCRDQDEVNRLWDALTADGGEPGPCGWLKDKYGLSWQIIPAQMMELIGGPDPEAAGRAMQAMLQMQKIDVAALQRAYDGE
jgi:predicted 3-demethylubiquinone-9 3-methyltransferase (glyoxalase superfamily)